MNSKRVTLDFETRSSANLKKVGAYKYSLDLSTMPTCLAVKLRGKRPYLLEFQDINRPWQKLPKPFRKKWEKLIEQGYLFVAHNAFFERCIYENIMVKQYGWPQIPVRSWRCTAAKAAACALPRSLEGAGIALDLRVQKDRRGYAAMMATCKPTKSWNAWRTANDKVQSGVRITAATRKKALKAEPPKFLEYEHGPQIWETLYQYCRIDVEAEEALDDALPDLIPEEQEIWHLNQRLNWRGLRIDIPTVEKIVGIMDAESKLKLKELDTLTMGLVTKPGARQSILDFLALEDIVLPDIKAKTIEDFLASDRVTGDMRRLLEIRKALSKASTKKYQGMLDRAWIDDRIRDILLFHGASTGRDTGTGVQPHNFPRGAIYVDKNRPYAAVENVAECDVELLKILYGDSLSIVFSSILRNMIIPSDGFELFVADFSKIEVAVLWWTARNWAGLEILKAGRDPYIYQAAVNLEKTYEEVERAVNAEEKWALDARQLGKAQIVGCGFGMAWKKFKTAAHEMYRLDLTSKQSVVAVKNYRTQNEAVPVLWRAYEDAAIEAVETKRNVKAGRCEFECFKGFLWIKLPSGRRLAYRKPRIVWTTLQYDVLVVDEKTGKETIEQRTGKPRKTIEFWGLAPNKKDLRLERTWGGTLTENIIQAIARDLMMPGMLRLEAIGYVPLFMAHDEGICEKKKNTGNLEVFTKELCRRPLWADENLPLDAKGWVGPRYRK